MAHHPLRTLRYLRGWLGRSGDPEGRELVISRGDQRVPTTVFRPRAGAPPFPAWIVLHGMTRLGRHHAQLLRFVRALTASRAVVVIPEVPEWMRLDLDPDVTIPTIRAALDLLGSLPDVVPGHTAVVGFSFGSPQAILSTSDPTLGPELAGAVGFGGYCDLERTVRFQFTGIHEWDGCLRHTRPDPYGRWIVGANFLTDVPGYEAAGDVADALRNLAREAGDRQVPARDPLFERRARARRSDLAPHWRSLFDFFAHPDGVDPDQEEVEELVTGLASAARTRYPRLDPGGRLGLVEHPVHLLHGRGDSLIPYTEALRLQREMPQAVERCTVTGLFAHSSRAGLPPVGTLLSEVSSFLGALNGVLRVPEGSTG